MSFRIVSFGVMSFGVMSFGVMSFGVMSIDVISLAYFRYIDGLPGPGWFTRPRMVYQAQCVSVLYANPQSRQ